MKGEKTDRWKHCSVEREIGSAGCHEVHEVHSAHTFREENSYTGGNRIS